MAGQLFHGGGSNVVCQLEDGSSISVLVSGTFNFMMLNYKTIIGSSARPAYRINGLKKESDQLLLRITYPDIE